MEFQPDKRLAPGFRFHPTDVELVMFYLKRKVLGRKLSPEVITVVDIYKFAPWDLPAMSCMRTGDLNWYFFCPRGKKYSSGERTNRATVFGYWKATGNDRIVMYDGRVVGKIKTLVFHRGKPPKGERTDWVMHEYRLEDQTLAINGVAQDSYVLCKFFQKSGLGPKNGEQYGAPFKDEEWEDDEGITFSTSALPTLTATAVCANCGVCPASSLANVVPETQAEKSPASSLANVGPETQAEKFPASLVENEELERMLDMFAVEADAVVDEFDVFEGLDELNDWKEFVDGVPQTTQSNFGELFLEVDDLDVPLPRSSPG